MPQQKWGNFVMSFNLFYISDTKGGENRIEDLNYMNKCYKLLEL